MISFDLLFISEKTKPTLHGENMEELLDSCLNNAHVAGQMRRIIVASSLCLRTYYKSRPTISLVRVFVTLILPIHPQNT
jgi:hypothetical protein